MKAFYWISQFQTYTNLFKEYTDDYQYYYHHVHWKATILNPDQDYIILDYLEKRKEKNQNINQIQINL